MCCSLKVKHYKRKCPTCHLLWSRLSYETRAMLVYRLIKYCPSNPTWYQKLKTRRPPLSHLWSQYHNNGNDKEYLEASSSTSSMIFCISRSCWTSCFFLLRASCHILSLFCQGVRICTAVNCIKEWMLVVKGKYTTKHIPLFGVPVWC